MNGQFENVKMDPRLGELSTVCLHCKAIRWPGERSTFCCQDGKVKIEIPPPPPLDLHKYFDINQSGHLLLPKCRSYNNALALASIGCEEKIQNGFNPTFKIQGKMYHRMVSLIPPSGNAPKFAQLFFSDPDTELRDRLQHMDDLDPRILKDLQEGLHAVNNYIKSFKSAIEVCAEHEDINIVLYAGKVAPNNDHIRTYNLPTTTEVAALLPGEPTGNLDIIVRCRAGDGQELRRINTCHRSYDPLHYVLMFPSGCDGWRLDMKKTDNRTLTATDFYCFRLQVRSDDFNLIFKLRKMMQQYAVDQWAKIEGSRLEWVRKNQKTIRAEKYQGLINAAFAGDNVDVGIKVILPATIYGSPRFYSEAFQDAMAIVRYFGKPDIFITFTCNPKWSEITTALHPGEQTHDRPDLSCRVFTQKYDALMDDLLKKEILGGVKAHTATIEFQKRGLPHAHILLILTKESKPITPESIDNIVSAEIPNQTVNPELYKIITSQNVHGPCGYINTNSPCMDNGRCTKNFPKPFQDSTRVTEHSYPQYRRRCPDSGGETHLLKVKGYDFRVDNSFIVPYNPLLSLRYQAHINVEIVHSVQAVKYLYTYITKGQDRILLGVQGNTKNDEVTRYLNARYISASEAFWRIYGFEIHRKHPPVEKLSCHLPNQQTVLFQPEEVQHAVDNGPPATKLTAYFQQNAEDPNASTILYPDFPHYFTWNSKDKKWQRRKRGARNPHNPEEIRTDCIGRIPTVSLSPHQAELYYLRMLLHHKPGATSYEDLRNINGIQSPTFQDACNKLGLLDDDTEKDAAMEEASAIRFGPQLRLAFATLLIYCRPADPVAFWNKHKVELCRDIMIKDKVTELNHVIENQVLMYLQDILDKDGLELSKDFHLPKAVVVESLDGLPKLVHEEMDHDSDNLKAKVHQEYPDLNDEQKVVFDAVMYSVQNRNGKLFALDASGGTGKTHTINLILAEVRSLKKIALATALSGIAATLLSNGRTLHSRCRVPICINELSTCCVSPRDATGVLLRQTDLLIIDEISMGHKHIYEAIDRTLKDIRGNESPFGGMTVLLAGDWRQILPVVRRGSRPEIVDATLKSSYLWEYVTLLQMKKKHESCAFW